MSNLTDLFFNKVATKPQQNPPQVLTPAVMRRKDKIDWDTLAISELTRLTQRQFEYTGIRERAGQVVLVEYTPLGLPDPVLPLPLLISWGDLRDDYIRQFRGIEYCLLRLHVPRYFQMCRERIDNIYDLVSPFLTNGEFDFYWTNMERCLVDPARKKV